MCRHRPFFTCLNCRGDAPLGFGDRQAQSHRLNREGSETEVEMAGASCSASTIKAKTDGSAREQRVIASTINAAPSPCFRHCAVRQHDLSTPSATADIAANV
jgi:hypothetical protein